MPNPDTRTPAARNTDPDTSHEGARRYGKRRRADQLLMLQLVERYPKRTSAEYAAILFKKVVPGLTDEQATKLYRAAHLPHRRLSELDNVHAYKAAKRPCTVTGQKSHTWESLHEAGKKR